MLLFVFYGKAIWSVKVAKCSRVVKSTTQTTNVRKHILFCVDDVIIVDT